MSSWSFMDLSAIPWNVQGQIVKFREPGEFFNRCTVTELQWSGRTSQNFRLPSILRVSACVSSSVYANPRVSDGGIKSKLATSAPVESTKFGSSKIVKLEPIRTLLLDNYDSYTYNLFQLLSVINGVAPVVLKNDEISWEELKHLLYVKRAFHNVVISPGPGSPKHAADIGVCMQLLKECGDIPILGVCMGHQALGCAHGADIVHAPEPVHGRLSEVEHNGNLLFKDIPSGVGSGFKVVRYHSLMIDAASLPEDLVPTAWTVLSEDNSPSGTLMSVGPNDEYHSIVGRQANGHQGHWNTEIGAIQANHWDGREFDSRETFVFREERCCVQLEDTLSLQHNAKQLPAVQILEELPNTSATGFNNPMKVNGHVNSLVERQCGEEVQQKQSASTTTRVVMGVSHRSRPHYGVQFHPESVATAYGKLILENFCNLTRDFWLQQPWKPCNLVGGENVLAQKGYAPAPYLKDPLTAENHAAVQVLQEIDCAQTMPFVTDKPANACILAVNHQLRVVWKKMAGWASQAGGSANIFCELFGGGHGENTFWLDSSTRDQGRARFSFMGGKGGPLWQRFTYKLCEEKQSAGILTVEDVVGNVSQERLDSGFFDFLEKALQKHTCNKQDIKDLPFDFCGGLIGYLGYELKVECGALSNAHSSPHPDAAFFLADQIVVVDHLLDDVYVLALYDDNVTDSSGIPETAPVNGTSNCLQHTPQVQAQKWVEGTVDQILTLCTRHSDIADETRERSELKLGMSKTNALSQFKLQTCRNSYVANVEKCLAYIREGESYEVCLTTQLKTEVDGLDSLGLYLTLRQTNPAPYAAWLHFGEKGLQICCSSPERFLRLNQAGILEAKPIKGTMPRGASPLEDEDLRKQLQNSEKDLAENLMIVDLLRNDLGRVCEAGSVHVPTLMSVESYATVHTLVSTVRGTKRSDMTPVACIRSAFPGGSMTGAPKLRTMELLDSIESSARGVYSGTIGFLSFNSSFDLNIVIRTLVMNEAEACIGAGGAVVALSDPEAEYEEMLLKTRAPIKAFSKFELQSKSRTQIDKDGAEYPRESEGKVTY